MAQFKLINNPFRREKNAEMIEFDEIHSLFTEPPDYEKYLQPGHCVLIGYREWKVYCIKSTFSTCPIKEK